VAHRLLYPGAVKLIVALCLALGLAACTSGETGDDDDTPAVDAGGETGTTAFMEDCTSNDECETGLCYQYNEGPQLCTHACTMNSDCELPSPGCNGMGVCKRPQ
jgi:hypothetical protein